MIPHASRIERLLSMDGATKGELERLSSNMKGWYGGPIPVLGVSGLQVHGDGDFSFSKGPNRIDRFQAYLRRVVREASKSKFNAGFATMDALIAAATNPAKRRDFAFQKLGTTGAQGFSSSLWSCAGTPAAGAAGAAAPGGTVPTDATLGSFTFANPAGGCTQHVANALAYATVANTLLMADRLFSVGKTMASVATEAVTGDPTRYQSLVLADPNYIGGNFLTIEARVVLAATAHNHTVVQYLDQAGNLQTMPLLAGISAAAVNRLDHAGWFCPLAAGSTGVKALRQMQHSASLASGSLDYAIHHPLAWWPLSFVAFMMPFDNVNTMINLTRIFDDACIELIEAPRTTTTATSYSGQFLTLETA